MDFSIEDLMKIIGELTVTNRLLLKRIEKKEKEIKKLLEEKEKTKVILDNQQ